ncbi:hypothetical protein conserved [Leishmania donovani]|uniref:Uncharacterized protein n=3 Tax=Leishmania donovani species complex TaxID=38574 RepID=A4HT54_LEIIN|nr:conserved hypothetical protein [Leishmania infantum JPCM5]XP_003858471.1 hypothetical protein, conserved [Leishmania donovani]CAC9447872.1 hypothetical_protein_-_conserved [Leishmania infantum]AYU76182.1 hypothetical protein LdCL_070006400 [Leishmania donovani]TPP40867.1 hypothetical protein CGC20_1525 [Leishmania donovani]TPP52432.1 hypothetical protein CGC21_10115 [Leishmania donovani]CAJ1986249.1 hypothetical protein conserved [Leishmania donovani]|eukprot:XP_001463245.1 conserved hypothetical protein [Leishmania infantum JPCM5]
MLLSSPVARAAQKAPVTAGLLVFMCLMLLLSSSKDLTCMHSALYELFPWRFVTYPLAMTTRQPWRVAVNTAVVLAGASAEASTGSSEYATFLLFTAVATGVLVLLTDLVMFDPLRLAVWGGNDSHNRPYGYTGVWPVAEVVGFSLCRVRGVSALVGPRLRCGQLTLQRLPLAIVWAAFGCDVVSLVVGRSAEDYNEHREGWQVMVASIALLVSWLYERRVTGAANSAFALEAFMYPDPLRDGARWVCGRVQRRLQASPLRFLLPPEGGVGGGAAALPTPLFSRAAVGNAFPGSPNTATTTTTTALLPGTTAEEAERHRLIAREALARRLQQQQSSASTPSAAEAVDLATKTA